MVSREGGESGGCRVMVKGFPDGRVIILNIRSLAILPNYGKCTCVPYF